jgi:hypothetical protein
LGARPASDGRGRPRGHELHLIEGGTHFDFYDRPQYAGPAVTKINEFFAKHL